MSLQTWKKQFYQFDASEIQEEDAVAHSLRKWIGLRQQNLEKHGLYKAGSVLLPFVNDREAMFIDDSSCALCYHHFHVKNEPTCENCPLYKELGGHACDETVTSPYIAWKQTADPEEMIMSLTNIVINRIEDKEFD